MENTVENIEGIVLDDAVQAPETQDMPEAEAEEQSIEPQAKEPGWISARVNDAVRKAEERIRAEYEAKLAPLYETMMDRQAQDLVEQGEFRSLDRAKEYVRMKGGYQPETHEEPEQDPYLSAKADFLAKQAEKIKANRGLDVMAVFNSDPDIKQRVLSGDMDFYDVAETMKRPLSPVRNPNGGNTNVMSIQGMSDEQFARLQKNLSGGKRYDMRK